MAGLADSAPRAEPVVFREAIDFLRRKLRLPTRAWTDVFGGQHAHAFVVAGATKDALLSDFQGALLKAQEEGTTFRNFQKDFDAIVARHGWSYRGGRAWRARTIFQSNMRSAHAAGRWRQILRTAERRPYLRYVQVQRESKRLSHEPWHGMILRFDHPFLQTHYPPNGWYCLCSVVQLSERDLRRRGWRVTEPGPEVRLRSVTLNTPDGPATIEVPEGIDPGWGHNPGLAAQGYGQQRVALAGHEGRWNPLIAPSQVARAGGTLEPVPPRAVLGPVAQEAEGERMRDLLRRAIGDDEVVFADPAGGQVRVGPALADHVAARPDGRERFFSLIPELIEDPQEIWAGFVINDQTGQVAVRRRYVKLLQLDRTRTIGLIADADNGSWSGLTFFRGNPRAMNQLRWGLPVYRQDPQG